MDFSKQFKSPIFFLLFTAVIISFLIGEKIDSLIILVFALINFLIVFFREYKAKKTVLFLNKLAKTLPPAEKKGSYEKNIFYFCRLILRIAVATIILIFIANILLKGAGSILELLFFSVALTASILPEALPAVVTFALAQGSMKMAKEHVVVKRLSAVEDLGNIDILCVSNIEDPLKSNATKSIKLAEKLGVSIKIFIGDSTQSKNVILGRKLEKMATEDFEDACERESVFARISPNLKNKIIKTLQIRHEVGFVGEGINDVQALKTANVGIVAPEASDIARAAADVVLLKSDLRVIVNGIKYGRSIFSNINKYIKCALASNFGNFYSIAVISLFINFLPMLPVQILLGNLLFNFFLISIATDSIDIEELKKPKMYQLHNVLPLIISLALVSTIFDFIFFSIFFKQPAPVIQTLWFIESILTEILLVFIIRTRGKFWKAVRPSFWLLLSVVLVGIFTIALAFLPYGQNWFHFAALPILPLLVVFFLIGCYFFVSEAVKLAYFKYWRPKDSVLS